SPRPAAVARPRRPGRLSATVYAECRVGGEGLVAARGQRRGRLEGCASDAWEGLLSALRGWRREQASLRGTPAYAILTDAALEAVAERDPRSAQELLEVPGIGTAEVAAHGAALLDLLGSHPGGN